MNSPETTVGVLAAILLVVIVGGRLLAVWFRGPVKPDPWGAEVSQALVEAPPLCLHCQTPHSEAACFCPNCGAAVGEFNNVSPYLYIFSLGEALRAGTQDRAPRRGLALAGYVLIALAEYAIFAPVYWFFLFRNYLRLRHTRPPPEPGSGL